MSFWDKLLFWRKDDAPTGDIEGCFTLPGAEVGTTEPAEACAVDDGTVEDGAVEDGAVEDGTVEDGAGDLTEST